MSIRRISFWADGTEEREVVLQLIKSDWCFIPALWFVFFLLSTGVGMNRSRSSWDKKAAQPPVTRLTRSTQTRQSDPTETQESGPGLYGKQRKKQTDSALAQDLSQMSVSGQDGLSTRWGHTEVSYLYLIFFFFFFFLNILFIEHFQTLRQSSTVYTIYNMQQIQNTLTAAITV